MLLFGNSIPDHAAIISPVDILVKNGTWLFVLGFGEMALYSL
jgi:hypothetical protein